MLIVGSRGEAAFFSGEMENFIRDGKEVTLILEEGIKEIKLIPQNSLMLYRVDDNGYINLNEDQEYSFKVESEKNSFFKIQIFATENRQKADEIWYQIKQLGYSEVKVIEEDSLYKVRLGHFQDKPSANKIAEELKKKGWNPWVMVTSEKLPKKISVYDMTGKMIYRGTALSVRGQVLLESNLYNGTIELKMNADKIKIYNRAALSDIVHGTVNTIIKDEEFKKGNLSPDQLGEFEKAYSIALRTYLLSNQLYQGDSIYFQNYKGLKDLSYINNYNNLANTDGIIIGNKEDGLTVANIGSPDIEEIIALIKSNVNYNIVLLNIYGGEIIDLNAINNRKTAVDAEVEWGLRYKEIRQINWQGPVMFTLLDLDLNSIRRFNIEPVLGKGQIIGLEDLGKMVKNKEMLAGINGGYFSYTGRPLGLIYKEGTVLAESVKDRTAMIYTRDNQVYFERVGWTSSIETIYNKLKVDGVNRKPGEDQITIFNKFYGKTAPPIKHGMVELVVIDGFVDKIYYVSDDPENNNGHKIPWNGYIVQAHGRKVQDFIEVEPGDFINLENNFSPDFKALNVKFAIAAGPLLVRNGQGNISSEEEEFLPDIAYGRAPRSAVGITKNNHLVFFTVDGRQPEYSVGITLKELAAFMIDQGVTVGMNLDGGSSARMVVRGFTMNSPSGDRLISNGILIGKQGN